MINNQLAELIKSLSDDQYIGHGNSNSNILFIGKEAGLEIGSEIYHGSVKSWRDNVDYSKPYIPEDKKIRNQNHTWFRYQKLYDYILEKLELNKQTIKKDKYEVSFVENVFTTELSSLPAPNTNDAKKQGNFSKELLNRKKSFFMSSFIQKFPVILIFATDNKYIETYSGEVCELFNVEFNRQINCSDRDKIWVHYSKKDATNNPKLVLHTRQLTNSISKDLISNIGDEVVDFMNKNNISLTG